MICNQISYIIHDLRMLMIMLYRTNQGIFCCIIHWLQCRKVDFFFHFSGSVIQNELNSHHTSNGWMDGWLGKCHQEVTQRGTHDFVWMLLWHFFSFSLCVENYNAEKFVLEKDHKIDVTSILIWRVNQQLSNDIDAISVCKKKSYEQSIAVTLKNIIKIMQLKMFDCNLVSRFINKIDWRLCTGNIHVVSPSGWNHIVPCSVVLSLCLFDRYLTAVAKFCRGFWLSGYQEIRR